MNSGARTRKIEKALMRARIPQIAKGAMVKKNRNKYQRVQPMKHLLTRGQGKTPLTPSMILRRTRGSVL